MMSLPLPLEPDRSTPGFDPEAWANVIPELERLWGEIAAVMRHRPAEGSEDESAACRTMINVFQVCASAPNVDLRAFTEAGVERALKEIVRAERTDKGDDWAFALRQLERAVDYYGQVMATVMKDVTRDDWSLALTDVEDATNAIDWLKTPMREYLLAQVLLLMAMDALTNDRPNELQYWAARANTAWRRVQAGLHELATRVEAELTRTRARRAWDNWTDEDRAEERATWKQLAESP